MKNFFYLSISTVSIFILFSFAIPDAHAVTFTAVKSGDWNNPVTWGEMIPRSSDYKIIPNGITVIIRSGVSNFGTGTISNSGTLKISDINHTYGISNSNIISNNFGGVIMISNTNGTGIINTPGGTISNSGTIVVSNVSGTGIVNIHIINNNSGGIMTVSNTGGTGLSNSKLGSGIINNHSGGIIAISNTHSNGISNFGTGTISNSGTITISNANGMGILNTHIIKNSGIFRISNTGGTGLSNDLGTKSNTGSTIYNQGIMIISDTGSTGIINTPGGTISNSGTMNKICGATYVGTLPSGNSLQDISCDTTPPVITPVITGIRGNNGWYTHDVTVSWSVKDAESSIFLSTGCITSVISSNTAGTKLVCSATSAGGTSSQSVTIKLDKTAPTITGAPTTLPNANGWYKSDVIVSYTAFDSLSGLVSPPADTIISTEGTSQSTSQTITDLAGNSATMTITGIKLDKTAPTIIAPPSITIISTKSAYPDLGSPTVNDNLDPSPIVSNDESFTELLPGTTNTITWTATDHAGNTATAIQQVTIKTPGQAINDLIMLGNSFGLDTNMLGNASQLLNDDNPNNYKDACIKLTVFINQANANNSLTSLQKTKLIQSANAIESSIGC